MIIKDTYKNKLNELKKIAVKYENSSEIILKTEEMIEYINEYTFRIVLIGGFSSGKSAFLNRIIGRKLFKENQGRETAIPAEISWAPVDSAFAVFTDGTYKEYPIENITATPPSDASYLTLTTNSAFLKAKQDVILVDFPGSDSNIEAHNKAISEYIQKGSAFILLVPAKNGGLTESDKKFLKEVAHYPQGLACFVSKSDLVTKEQCNDVIMYIRKNIQAVYCADVFIDAVSIKEDFDPDFHEKVSKALDCFHAQELFDISMAVPINVLIDKSIILLEQHRNVLKLDLNAIDEKIIQSEIRQQELKKQLENERRNLDNKYQREIIPNIMNQIENALHSSIDSLAESALAGQMQLIDNIQYILRPVLNSIPAQIQDNLKDLFAEIKFNFSVNDAEENETLKKVLLNAVNVVTSLPTFADSVKTAKTACNAPH